MSAIVGVVQSRHDSPAYEIGNAMMDHLSFCQADDIHSWSEGPVYFGCYHQRLTEEAMQERIPYHDTARGLIIAADAILDNRDDLCDRLGIDREARHHIGDAQLILLSYAQWGEACPKYLLGDFAFMLWDERKGQLFGARDLCGNRTLYYTHHDQRLSLSTTMTPLLNQEGMGKELELKWLAEYLAITGMHECTDASLTPYRHVYHVPPAHSFKYSNGVLSFSQYGTITPQDQLVLRDDEEYEEAFREVVDKAVSARLRTRHQVAASLSGGLDSGTVASFASRALREQGKKLHTFSFIPVDEFEDWTPKRLVADERPYIRSTVQHVGNIEDYYFHFADKNPVSDLNESLDILEAPYKFFGGMYWIKGIYEEASRRRAGVLLTGGRGNFTISWGPALDYYASLLKQFQWLQLYNELHAYSRRVQVGRLKLLTIISRKAFPMINGASRNVADQTPRLIHSELARATGVMERFDEMEKSFDMLTMNSFEERMKAFNNLANANKSGAVATKLSLRYGLWERDPTFDARVVRFCLAVPAKQYVRNGIDRALVRRSMAGYLPDQVLLNQTIRGVQAADWVYRLQPVWPHIIAELERMCSDSAVNGIMNLDFIRDTITDYKVMPRPEHAFHPKMQYLMRSLILYRFLKNSF